MPSGSSPSVRPITRISPAVGRRCPMIILMMVDFPAPFTPSRPKTAPRGTHRETVFTASTCPNLRPRFSVSMSLSPKVLSKSRLIASLLFRFRLTCALADRLGGARLHNVLKDSLERVAQLALRQPEVDRSE